MTMHLEDELREALAGRAGEVSLPPDLLARVRAGTRARRTRTRWTAATAAASLAVVVVALAGARVADHGQAQDRAAGGVSRSFAVQLRPSGGALYKLPGVEVTALPAGFLAAAPPQVTTVPPRVVPDVPAGATLTGQEFTPGGRPYGPVDDVHVVGVQVFGPLPSAADARALLASRTASPVDGGMRREAGTVDGQPADLLVNGANVTLTAILEPGSRYVVEVSTSYPDRAELLRVVAGLRPMP